MIFSLKNSYSENHSKTNFKNKNEYNHRKDFGIREIQTIKLLSKYFLKNTNLNLICESESNIEPISLLDIGCGDRYLSYGCDYNNISYEGIDADTCNIEIERVNFNDETFDVVASLAVIEHLNDPSNLINESYRLLKYGGMFIVSTPNWRYCVEDFYNDPTHVKPYTEKSLDHLLNLSPFNLTKVIPNLRCMPKSAYSGNLAFFRAAKLRFFQNSPKLSWIPGVFKGKARGLFGIGIKS